MADQAPCDDPIECVHEAALGQAEAAAAQALGRTPDGAHQPSAYINGDDGVLSLHCGGCDGHIAFIEAGDDFDQLDLKRRAHTCTAPSGAES